MSALSTRIATQIYSDLVAKSPGRPRPIPRHLSLVPWSPPPPSPAAAAFLERMMEELVLALGLPLETVGDGWEPPRPGP